MADKPIKFRSRKQITYGSRPWAEVMHRGRGATFPLFMFILARGAQTRFTETDRPNLTHRTKNCSFYSGTKALAEEMRNGKLDVNVWRLRIPFHHVNNPRDYFRNLDVLPAVTQG
jgi:hypothetical protein